MRGATIREDRLYTWGKQLLEWNLKSGTSKKIAESRDGGFGEGGCAGPSGEVYLQDGPQAGPLVVIEMGSARAEWDPKVEMHDCTFTPLLGQKGLLITDHFGQVRFYEGRGVYTEIYSFYTPSRQAGLLLTDINGDGLPDIVCGNYWIRSPAEFDLPWRLFAINLRHEKPDSATMRLARIGNHLYEAQAHAAEGALFLYTPLPDPTQRWAEQVVIRGLHYPHALAAAENGVVAGENHGPGSRLFYVGEGMPPRQIGTTDGVHSAFFVEGRVLTVGAHSIRWWTIPGQRRK